MLFLDMDLRSISILSGDRRFFSQSIVTFRLISVDILLTIDNVKNPAFHLYKSEDLKTSQSHVNWAKETGINVRRSSNHQMFEKGKEDTSKETTLM